MRAVTHTVASLSREDFCYIGSYHHGTNQYTNRRYLDALNQRVLIFDGAMGTSLQKMNLTAEHFGGERTNGCNDYLVITYPQAVEDGAPLLPGSGCGCDRNRYLPLQPPDPGGIWPARRGSMKSTRRRHRLARRLADEYSTPEQPRFVAGSIGPSGKLPSMDDPELSNVSFRRTGRYFPRTGCRVDRGRGRPVLIETSQDILEVKAAIVGIQQAFAETGICLPIQAQVTLDTTGRMLLGTDIAAVLTILEGLPIDVIGLNCSTGPDHMREPIRYLGEQSSLPVSCIPNAGLPLNVDGQAVYPLEPEPFADSAGGICREIPYQCGGRLLRHHPGASAPAGGKLGAASNPRRGRIWTSRGWPPPSRRSRCCRNRGPS